MVSTRLPRWSPVRPGWHARRTMVQPRLEPRVENVVGVTTLITGTNELIAERTISAIRDAVRSADVDADLIELQASQLGAGALVEIASPSLFASMRAVVVRSLQDLAPEAVDALHAYVERPASDVALVLHHTGGVKGKAVLDRLRKARVVEIKAEALKGGELRRWLMAEFRRLDARVSDAVARALVEAIGEDMRALAGAAGQLVSDAGETPITEGVVRRYFGGRAEVKGFAVADAAIDGKAAEAFERLRWAMANRVDPVLITSAVAGGLRALVRYQAAPRGLSQGDLAREVGVPPFKLETLPARSRAWSARGLGVAIQAAAQADADVKGLAVDRLWAVERLVISVLRARALR